MTVRASIGAAALTLTLASMTVAQAPPATRPSRPAPPPARRAADAVTPRVKDPQRHAQFMLRIKEGPVGLLFMGDSILDAWPRLGEYSWLKFAPDQPADFGIGGDSTEHVLWRITHGELDGINPRVVVLLIGTNNIGHVPADRPEWAAAGVRKVLETTHQKLPQAKVLLLAVFPRDAKGSVHRTAVEQMNAVLKTCDDGDKTRYLDIGHVFLDADGELPKDVMPDKLHPTAKGYDLWYDAMHPLLEEMMK